MFFALAVLFLMASCEKEKESVEEEEKVTIKLDVTNLTDDGYFDGLLYYKVTSNSPFEVSVNKVENTAIMVEIPSRIQINGNDYSCTSVADEAFYECRTLSSIFIPKTIRSIGTKSFYGCSGLKNVTISEGVTRIGESAFYCSGLTSITIPESVTSIEKQTFSYCSRLTSISIPESVTSIEKQAFSSCSGLTSITLPESVTSIGEYAFEFCIGLTSVVCKGRTPPTCGDDVFTTWIEKNGYKNYTPYCQTVTLYIPQGSKKAYQNSEPWKFFKEIIEQ